MKSLKIRHVKPMLVVAACIALMLTFTAHSNEVKSVAELDISKHHHMKKAHKLKAMMKKITLNAHQQEQIQTIKKNARSENEALLVQIKSFKNKEKMLMQREEFSEEEYIELLDEYQSVRSQLALNKAKNKHEINQILSPEQRDKMNSYKRTCLNNLSL